MRLTAKPTVLSREIDAKATQRLCRSIIGARNPSSKTGNTGIKGRQNAAKWMRLGAHGSGRRPIKLEMPVIVTRFKALP